MTINGDIAANAISVLSAAAELKDISFVQAYENTVKPTPLTKPIAAVSVRKCEIGDYIKKTLDTGEIVTTAIRPVDTTLSVDIYMPYSMGGLSAHRVFDRIATAVLFGGKLKALSGKCYDADYDKACQAILLRSEFLFSTTTTT